MIDGTVSITNSDMDYMTDQYGTMLCIQLSQTRFQGVPAKEK